MNKIIDGDFAFIHMTDWYSLPDDYVIGEVAGVAVAPNGNVYAFNRGPHPIIIFDKDGKFISSWGDGVFKSPHGITIGFDERVYCVDEGDHTVRIYNLEGDLQLMLGTPGKAGGYHSGNPYNRPTDVALDPTTGDFYVSDGYGNSRVHKYSPDGKHILSWGKPGMDPGEFNIVHNIATDSNGLVYVNDRESHRVQIFDSNGKYQSEIRHVHRPCALYISPDDTIYVGELAAEMSVNKYIPNFGPRITVIDNKGNKIARLGKTDPQNMNANDFAAPHSISSDSEGNMYVGEVSHTFWRSTGRIPPPPPSFHKLVSI